MAKEQELRLKCIKYAKSKGWTHLRLHFGPGAAKGWPDDIFLYPGARMIWAEFKAPDGVVSDIQKERIKTLKSLGCIAAACRNYEKFANAIDRLSWKSDT